MSTLFVNQIKSATGTTITIPTGNSLSLDGRTLDSNSLMPVPTGNAGKGVASNGTSYYYNSYGANRIVTFTSNGTYVPPVGVNVVFVRVQAAGGGGSGYAESGGAGGYAEGFISMVGVSSVSVTVGTGGNPTFYSGAAGAGSASSFGSYMTATGGNGANSSHQHCGGLPGLGSGGQINIYGGGGTGHGHNGRGGGGHFGGSGVGGHPQGGAYAPNHQSHAGFGSGGTNGWATSYTGAQGKEGVVVIMEFG
jgi:hypothetical protein